MMFGSRLPLGLAGTMVRVKATHNLRFGSVRVRNHSQYQDCSRMCGFLPLSEFASRLLLKTMGRDKSQSFVCPRAIGHQVRIKPH